MKKRDKQDQYNALNERVKYLYRIYLKRVLRKDETTILKALEYLRVFEIFINFLGFETYNKMQADKYIDHLFDNNFSSSFINNTLRELKEFLAWLQRQKGYRSKIKYDDISFLNATNNQRRAAKAPEHKKSYS